MKKIKITNVSELTKGTLEVGKEYEVIRENRIEFLVHVSDSVMVFVEKRHAELIED